MKNILFAASECAPFVKSGGLADVVGSLPEVLQKKGNNVSVVLPLYSKIISEYYDQLNYDMTIYMDIANYNFEARIYSLERNSITYYFIENQYYFERDNLYGYYDDGERFSFFQHAIYKMLLTKNQFPDIIHSHDWHTGMMAPIARIFYKFNENIQRIKQVFTIHNLFYQGNFSHDMLEPYLGISNSFYYDGTLEFNRALSFMKSAIIYSNKISTVSNSYAYEILDSQYGEKLQDVLRLREHDIWGILNGIDTELYNPKTDSEIPKRYSVKSLYNKFKNKLQLQEDLGLVVDKEIPLIGMVTRLTDQKGINLVVEKMHDIMNMNVQLVVLGTGDQHYTDILRNFENQYKGKMVFYNDYSERIAREIYSASDLFLMPSKFEPCGISQLISMRYAALPIVREIGGLKDTVEAYNKYENSGNGFTFAGFNSNEMFEVLEMAVNLYHNEPKTFRHLQENAMKTDVSWDKSANLYQQMYNEM